MVPSESMELRDDASQKSRAPSELCTVKSFFPLNRYANRFAWVRTGPQKEDHP